MCQSFRRGLYAFGILTGMSPAFERNEAGKAGNLSKGFPEPYKEDELQRRFYEIEV